MIFRKYRDNVKKELRIQNHSVISLKLVQAGSIILNCGRPNTRLISKPIYGDFPFLVFFFFFFYIICFVIWISFSIFSESFGANFNVQPVNKETTPRESGVKHIDLTGSKFSNKATPEEPELCAQSPQSNCSWTVLDEYEQIWSKKQRIALYFIFLRV